MKSMWIKKYTKLKYLETILRRHKLHLGDPKSWDDKNDAFSLEQYRLARSLAVLKVTCLTTASDRYHFWKEFGSKEDGVCLWFDRKQFINGISSAKNTACGYVKYLTPTQLVQINSLNDLRFAKRAQFYDEQEYRIVYEGGNRGSEKSEYGFSFPISSLKRIYLNGWLSIESVHCWKKRIEEYSNSFGHDISVKQNRATNSPAWKCAVQELISRF